MRFLFVVLFFVSAASVAVENNQDLLDNLIRCRDEPSDASRLACYDRLSQPVEVPAVSESSAEPVIPEVPPAAAIPITEEDFGNPKVTVDLEPEQITATVSESSVNPLGKLRVTLENGQIWQQVDSSRFRVKQGEQVTIKQAALGSYLLNRVGFNGSIRVKRIR